MILGFVLKCKILLKIGGIHMDLILKNGKIIILDELNTITEAIAIKGGKYFPLEKMKKF